LSGKRGQRVGGKKRLASIKKTPATGRNPEHFELQTPEVDMKSERSWKKFKKKKKKGGQAFSGPLKKKKSNPEERGRTSPRRYRCC